MNYRNTRSSYLNCEKNIFNGVGEYEVPAISPIDIDIENALLIGFNYAKTEKNPNDKIVHFFLDDYQFTRVWNNPDIYLSVLRRFKAVLSPDFSTYTDFPKAVSIFNHYRKQWLGAYWQSYGINVIPTIGWSTEDSYEYCFDGIPHDSLVCISTVGSFANKENKEAFLRGYKKSLDVLTPKKILFYGKLYPELDIPSGIEYSVATNDNMKKLSDIRDSQREEKKKNKSPK